MAFLPISQRPDPWGRYAPPPSRDVVRAYPIEKRNSVLLSLLLIIAFAAVLGWTVRAGVEPPRTAPTTAPVSRQAETPPAPTSLCSGPDGTLNGWHGNTGFAPRDVFGFLPKCNDAGRRQ